MMTARHSQTTAHAPADTIVTHADSELARTLRARGWVVRSGWRSTQRGKPVWLVRLVSPLGSSVEPVLTAPAGTWLGLAA